MIPKLQRASLADQVAQHLLATIRQAGLAPGDSLPSEAALAERFGVSRPVVREAIGHLKSLGIVATHSGRPAVLQRVDARLPALFFALSLAHTDAGTTDLLEVRRGLEVQSAALAAHRRGSADVAAMHAVVTQLGRHLDEGDLDAFVDADVELHLLIATAARNGVLLHLIEAIRSPLRDTIRLGLESRSTPDDVQFIRVLHERIVAAIADGDATTAATAMADHFDRALLAIDLRRRHEPHL